MIINLINQIKNASRLNLLKCQVFVPGNSHIIKNIYFQLIHILWKEGYIDSYVVPGVSCSLSLISQNAPKRLIKHVSFLLYKDTSISSFQSVTLSFRSSFNFFTLTSIYVISKSGNRFFIKASNLNKLLFYYFKKNSRSHLGLVLLLTEKGIITHTCAVNSFIGGLVLCIIF